MARSPKSAKSAGTSFETLMTGYLRTQLNDDRIERRARNGSKDRGDIGGVRCLGGGRVVLECKDRAGKYAGYLGQWLLETHKERNNDDAIVGIVLAKRLGTRVPGEQYVIMTAADLVALITGERPNE